MDSHHKTFPNASSGQF